MPMTMGQTAKVFVMPRTDKSTKGQEPTRKTEEPSILRKEQKQTTYKRRNPNGSLAYDGILKPCESGRCKLLQ